MCDAPDLPAAQPERQPLVAPNQGAADVRQGDKQRRRLGLAANILTGPRGGVAGALNTAVKSALGA